MNPFIQHTGLVVPLDRTNVDTDQIIPKQFLKRVERSGFGQFLFFDWRFDPAGNERPEFVLNDPRYCGASVLLARDNFGCGSSREHAPWALADFGFRVLIAPSFADIFYNNCFKNGLLAIRLDTRAMQELFDRCQANENYKLSVNLEEQSITDAAGLHLSFEIDPFRKECLLKGLDDIALTLEHEASISAFETARAPLSASQ